MSTAFRIPDWVHQTPPTPSPPVDHRRIEGLVNRFIAGKHEALFTAPDAFYRLEGWDAIEGTTAIGERLQALRTALLAQTSDDSERDVLGQRLDLHIGDAMEGVGRHVTKQRQVYRREVIAERQRLIQRDAEFEHDNDDKIEGLAYANASAALARARMDGVVPNSPEESVVVQEARSQILRTVINERIANRKNAHAVALFDRLKDQLSPGDLSSLNAPIEAARNDATVDVWLQREMTKPGSPLAERAVADPDLSPAQKAIATIRVLALESAHESNRVATLMGLDDQVVSARHTLATAPASHKTGTFAKLANAYVAAGHPQKAAEVRRLAILEPFLRAFAQTSPDRQQNLIESLPEQDRPAAEAIKEEQSQAFARDAFSAGTNLYARVGLPVPIDDIDGRIQQARLISAYRHIPVSPFTVKEIEERTMHTAMGNQQTVEPEHHRSGTTTGACIIGRPDFSQARYNGPTITDRTESSPDFAFKPAFSDEVDELLHQVQAVGDNKASGTSAEEALAAKLKQIDPRAQLVGQVRLYVNGGPDYMVGDIILRGNGGSMIIIEVKSGFATLSPSQIKALAAAARGGGVYITNEAAAGKIGIRTHATFGSQGILPEIYVVGGDSEKIERQMRKEGIDVRRGGVPGRMRIGGRPI